jgi:peroxiredoxin (alkyl hydroperoxide reductase subunit C)
MSLINSEVKPFKATAYHNGKFVPVSNEDLKGKWSVFVFYPADFTFVCPTELGDLADVYPEFKKLGVEIYGISTDTHFTHKAWHDTSDTIKKVQYPLVGDPTLALSRAFEVLIEEEGLAYRGTFVIDPSGHIKIIEVHDNGIGRDAKELLRKVQAAQYVASHPGEVCPAKWTPGAASILRFDHFFGVTPCSIPTCRRSSRAISRGSRGRSKSSLPPTPATARGKCSNCWPISPHCLPWSPSTSSMATPN